MTFYVGLLWMLMLWKTVQSIKVIGGKQSAVQGHNISLPCTLTGKPADDGISQIFWKKKTGQKPVVDFFTISPEYGPEPVNGRDGRFSFIGSLTDNNGTILFSDVKLSDEGIYTCIFTLFPSGSYRTDIPLTVLVPPVTSLEGEVPAPDVGDGWVTYASCKAAGAKPPAEVTWDTGSSGESLRVETNSTQHANGTTTTVSRLVGIPTINTNRLLVQCVVKQQALATADTLAFTIMVHYAPLSANIHETSRHVFECVSDSSPKATYTWSRMNQSLTRSGISAEGGRLQFISLASDMGGLYVCEASNPYGQKNASLYVYHDTGPCTTCWTLFIISFVINLVVVAAGVALWFYKQRLRASPGREARPLRHSTRPPSDLHENQRREEGEEEVEEEGDRETQS